MRVALSSKTHVKSILPYFIGHCSYCCRRYSGVSGQREERLHLGRIWVELVVINLQMAAGDWAAHYMQCLLRIKFAFKLHNHVLQFYLSWWLAFWIFHRRFSWLLDELLCLFYFCFNYSWLFFLHLYHSIQDLWAVACNRWTHKWILFLKWRNWKLKKSQSGSHFEGSQLPKVRKKRKNARFSIFSLFSVYLKMQKDD